MANLTPDVLASTLAVMKDEAMDNLFKATVLLNAMDKKGGLVPVEQIDGGSELQIPVIVRDHSVITDLDQEDAAVSIAASNVMDYARFDWAHAVAPVILGTKVKLENQGPSAKVSALEARMRRALEQLRFALNKKLIANPVGSKFNRLTTLFGVADGNGSSTGVFEGLAFGSQVNSVGGIDKETYPTAWQHQFGDASDLFGTNGLNVLDLLIGDCQKYSMNGKPHLILTNRSVWSNLRRALRAVELYEGASEAKEFGYGSLVYNGVPVDYDLEMPAQTGSDADEEVGAYVLNLEDIRLHHLKGAWFDLGDWTDGLFGQFAGEGAPIHVSVALGVRQLSTSGILVDANTYS